MRKSCYILIAFLFVACKTTAPQGEFDNSSWLSDAPERDNYNTYIWNRANVARGNGRIDTNPWYEWWYYKVVIPETGDSFYFTYGIVNPWDTKQTREASRAYVDVGNFSEKEEVSAVFPVKKFIASRAMTDVRIGVNNARADKIIGDVVNDEGEKVSWNIDISKNWRFNAMSWGMGIPNLSNIYWYPAQASARFSGEIIWKGKNYKFSNAPGYQDRNWGNSFPKWWAWIVSNKFEGHPNTALAIGGGQPKTILSSNVAGLCVGLLHKGKEYTFRPQNLQDIDFDIRFGKWEVDARSSSHRLVLSATAPRDKFLDLEFMTPQGEIFHDYETLTGTMNVKLYKKKSIFYGGGWELIENLRSEYTGIEYGSKTVYP